jgi:hypothetical protein
VPLRHRGWILVVGLIAISIAGVVVATRFIGSPTTLDGAGMASYMPQRDAAVLFIDVAALRSTGILEKLVGSTVAEEPEYKAFVQQSGFDYKRDLDRVMVNSAERTHYLLAEGRFEWDKLKKYAGSQGGSCDGDFCTVKGSTPGQMVSFYPVSKRYLAIASSSNANAARDINSRSPVKLSYDIPARPLWLHVPSSVLRRQTDLPAGTRLFTRALEPAQRVMFSLGPQAEKFELKMDVTCRTPEDAVVLKNQLEGITKLLQSLIAREKQSPTTRDLSGVLTSGSFERAAEHVIGRWPIDKAFIDSLGSS